jgi:hypothetical protein
MSDLDDFIHRHSMKVVNSFRSRKYTTMPLQPFSNSYARYASDIEECITFNIEIDSRTMEQLALQDADYLRMLAEEKDEWLLRKQYPALLDAYQKYQTLLGLVK